MIETPNTFWKPAANTASHISGRTSAESSRPRCCTNLMISRTVTARNARRTWINLMSDLGRCYPLFNRQAEANLTLRHADDQANSARDPSQPGEASDLIKSMILVIL